VVLSPARSGGADVRIEFERSGGFAGLRRLPVTISDDSLSADESAAWRRLIESADFFHQPENPPRGPGADQFQFRVTVEMDGRRHTVRVSEGSIPPALQPLIERLKEGAQH
jgi:hypothetical protein